MKAAHHLKLIREAEGELYDALQALEDAQCNPQSLRNTLAAARSASARAQALITDAWRLHAGVPTLDHYPWIEELMRHDEVTTFPEDKSSTIGEQEAVCSSFAWE